LRTFGDPLHALRAAQRRPATGDVRLPQPAPLTGIRVLDLSSGPVGGVATTVLADFGADVVKVEPPDGERFRAFAASPLWLRGKRSVAADLRSAEGRGAVQSLARACDVLVLSGPPRRAAQWQLTPADLAELNAAAVHCQITPWGPRGALASLPGYEALVAARAGRTRTFGRQLRGDAPGFAALPVAQHACAMGAVQGIVAALLARARSGRRQRVETSLLQGLLPYDLVELLLVQLADRGAIALPDPSAGDMPTLNYHPVLASDGRWIQCGNLLEHLFYAFLDALELLPELLGEERFQGSPAQWSAESVEAARDRILLRVRERPAAEWMARFRANGNVAAEPYRSAQEALAHPDLLANGEIVTLADPRRGEVRTIGAIARLSATPARVARPAPEIGAHTAEVSAEWQPAQPAARQLGEGHARPLEGILVIDLSTIIAGPLATSMLSDLGARVIKVEPPSGDPSRQIIAGGSLAVRMNGGKESLAVDLKTSEGRALLRALVARADVVVHNFRRGVAERLGIGFEDCRALNPRVVWAAVSGYGSHGADAARPATHPVVGAAMSGATHQAGDALRLRCESLAELREAARQLMRANEANPDPNTSSVAAAAILLALLARERGLAAGQRVDVSMLVANAWANADDFLAYAGKPERPALDAALRGFAPGYRLYEARDGWLMLAVVQEAEWLRLAAALGDPALASPATRSAEALEAHFRGRSAAEWEALLAPQQIGCARADGPAPGRFWSDDLHVRENGFVASARHARHGDVLRWGALVHVNGFPSLRAAAPLCGEHTDSVLAELGRSAEEIASLRARGVVASEKA
jgi:crotonobetainyl-CoA:carnitine CoA-transferase CaiB-like acyl-CoA transferase